MDLDRRLSEGPLQVGSLWSAEHTERLPGRVLEVESGDVKVRVLGTAFSMIREGMLTRSTVTRVSMPSRIMLKAVPSTRTFTSPLSTSSTRPGNLSVCSALQSDPTCSGPSLRRRSRSMAASLQSLLYHRVRGRDAAL